MPVDRKGTARMGGSDARPCKRLRTRWS